MKSVSIVYDQDHEFSLIALKARFRVNEIFQRNRFKSKVNDRPLPIINKVVSMGEDNKRDSSKRKLVSIDKVEKIWKKKSINRLLDEELNISSKVYQVLDNIQSMKKSSLQQRFRSLSTGKLPQVNAANTIKSEEQTPIKSNAIRNVPMNTKDSWMNEIQTQSETCSTSTKRSNKSSNEPSTQQGRNHILLKVTKKQIQSNKTKSMINVSSFLSDWSNPVTRFKRDFIIQPGGGMLHVKSIFRNKDINSLNKRLRRDEDNDDFLSFRHMV